eukprot:CAMPEP_0196151056 /NCGR_PEP_ID=MMETSP0910-20130528/32947_1 /TAXON_ID=49265 /ORGANISM="Thalassiosira rotula, Strain GSO102" /LENGTH=32 /DNA_ID= /DNA_START= /DNA_END= /DNA_ORIENTATION=
MPQSTHANTVMLDMTRKVERLMSSLWDVLGAL